MFIESRAVLFYPMPVSFFSFYFALALTQLNYFVTRAGPPFAKPRRRSIIDRSPTTRFVAGAGSLDLPAAHGRARGPPYVVSGMMWTFSMAN